MSKVLVTGAGGFIGHHLVRRLKADGHWVRGVDIKPPEFDVVRSDEFHLLDLRRWESCLSAVRDVDEVYALAVESGDLAASGSPSAHALHASALIDLHTLEAARLVGVRRYLYASDARVREEGRADDEVDTGAAATVGARNGGAGPNRPIGSPAWIKEVGERMCRQYLADYGLQIRIARLHEVHGPLSRYEGRGASVVAAACRATATAPPGTQPNLEPSSLAGGTLCHVDDCCGGLIAAMRADEPGPFDVAGEPISFSEMLTVIASVARGEDAASVHSSNHGVSSIPRDRDDEPRRVPGWQPHVDLAQGLETTYEWVAQRLRNRRRGLAAAERGAGEASPDEQRSTLAGFTAPAE